MISINFFFYLAQLSPPPLHLPPYSIGVTFCPGYTRFNFSSRGISDVPLINKHLMTDPQGKQLVLFSLDPQWSPRFRLGEY